MSFPHFHKQDSVNAKNGKDLNWNTSFFWKAQISHKTSQKMKDDLERTETEAALSTSLFTSISSVTPSFSVSSYYLLCFYLTTQVTCKPLPQWFLSQIRLETLGEGHKPPEGYTKNFSHNSRVLLAYKVQLGTPLLYLI